MGVNLSIKDVPEAVAERLRQRAARNHRSLQGELMAIVEQAAGEVAPDDDLLPQRSGAARAPRVQGWKSVQQVAEEARRRNAEQQAREQAHERMLRLERLRGYLASAEDRLSRLTRPNDRADQQRRVDEIRAQIAREEGR